MKRFISLLVLFMLVSCGKEVVFTETFKDFPDKRWTVEDVKKFTIDIDHNVQGAKVLVHFSYVHEPGYDTFPVGVVWEGTDGKTEKAILNVNLKEDGKDLGSCAGDVCDLVIPFKEFDTLGVGTYKIVLYNKFSSPYLPNVLALGVSVEHLD